MFWQIFLFELKYRSKRPATYIYFTVFFLLGMLVTSTGSSPASEKVFHNSPYVIADFNVYFSMIMMLVCSAIMGVPLYRDIEYGTKNYYLSYPITRAGYFWGRYLGSFFFVFLIGFSLSSGLYTGTFLSPLFGWVAPERIGPNHFINYIQPYFTMALPNLFLSSSIFFGLVAYFRDVKVIYSGSILLFIGYLLAGFLIRDIDNKNLVKILDPFAANTFQLETRFYTPAEQNTLLVPVKGLFLLNRILWTGVGLVILMATYFGFSFERFFTGRASKKQLKEKEIPTLYEGMTLPNVAVNFTSGYYRKVMANLAKIEFLNIVRDNYFRAILLGAVVFLVIDFWIGNTTFGVSALPLTVNLIDYKNFDYVLFIYIIIIFYTGEAVHRERTSGFALINDALPTPDWVLFGSKLLGLTAMAFVLASIPLAVGLIIQLLKGYHTFHFEVYFIELYVISFPQFIQIVMLSIFIHTVANNKFAGHAIGLLVWIAMFLLRTFGEMNYNLFFYSYYPAYQWSDMDGINSMAAGIFWFNLYWLFFGSILLLVAALFFNRGTISGASERWKVARQRFKGALPYAMAFFLFGFLLTGAYCYYNVSYINNYISTEEGRYRQSVYEKTLKKYEHLPQPKITSVKLDIDVYPERRTTTTHALIWIKNKSGVPISDIHFNGTGQSYVDSFAVKYNGAAMGNITYPLVYKRGKFNLLRPSGDSANYRIYHLSKAMLPGDSAVLEINAINLNRGFTNSMSGTDQLRNGTFFAGGLPSLGYNSSDELESDEKRKKYKLPKKNDNNPPFNDPVGVKTFLFNDEGDWVTMDITVSTVKGQTAIAPGRQIDSWEKNNRVYTRFSQTAPKVNLFFDVVSARYALLRGSQVLPGGANVALELYYHKEHDRNLNRFLAAYKDGLDYYSKSYGNYQFGQLRLLEFPKYRAFAQSFPNTVSYSEAFGYTADFKSPNDFDYAYFVTAHELAHQWWGHQVSPNRTLGSNLMSEALAEYTALILCERKYGRDNMKRFLRQELDSYLRGRANETKKENVFIDCNRPYEWYNKGSLILYGLRDLIGEDHLNRALKEFRDAWAFKENPPFPGSHDLYNSIDKAVPDSLKYYLEDTWKRITLYNNKVLDVKSEPGAVAGEQKITMKVYSQKMYADSSGNEKPAPFMDDYIDIGLFAADSKDSSGRTVTNPLYLRKHRLKAGETTVTIIVKGKVVKAGIDPYIKLIDRIPDDNMKDL